MTEKILPVTIDMFGPTTEERSPDTNMQLALLMKDFWGRGQIRVYRGLQAGGVLSEAEAGTINKQAFKSMRRFYNLQARTDTVEFYLQNQKPALGVPERYCEYLPEIARYLEPKDEIGLLSERPSDLFRLLSKAPENVDPTLAYEAHRHLILSHISAMINARTLNGRLRTRLADIHYVLNEKLFEGVEGAGNQVVVESYHDDETNEVVGFMDRGTQMPRTANLKRIPFTVRKIKDIGEVYTSTRKKDDVIAIIKSIGKAKSNGGRIDVSSDVLDSIGMIAVLMNDDVTPQDLASVTIESIKSDERYKDVKIEEDDATSTDSRNSSEYRHIRRKVWFGDLPVPLEMIFYSREAYLNSRLAVGKRDQDTGLFMGSSHKLYDLRRAREAAPVIYPKEIYPVDLDSAFIRRSKLIAQGLREE